MTTARPAARRRREQTRARLIAAAEEVFADKGVRRVTVDDIVGAAGFTRGAFYSNFSSIIEVFYALFEDLSGRMISTVREVVEQASEEDFSIGLILQSLQPVSRRWFVIQAEFTLLAVRDESARTTLRAQHERFEEEMHGLISAVLDRLDREPVIPLTTLSESAIGLYLHALGQEALGVDRMGVRTLSETVLPSLLLSLSREKG